MKSDSDYPLKKSDIESVQDEVMECKQMIKKLSNNINKSKVTDDDAAGAAAAVICIIVIVIFVFSTGRWA